MNVFIKREYDYAIRICAFLAGSEKNKPISLGRIASLLYITRPFATKIVHQLIQREILSSTQGKYGGIFLRRDPQSLSVFDILEAMAFNSTLNECIKNHQICPLKGFCQIHFFFKQQENKLLESFRNQKLIDFAIHEKDLNNYPESTESNINEIGG